MTVAATMPDPNMLERFGIALDAGHFEDPALNLEDDGKARIEVALAEVAAGVDPGQPGSKRQEVLRTRLAPKAVKRLMQGGHLAEAAHLAAAVGPIPLMIRLQAVALQRLRARADLARLITRHEADPDLPEALRDMLGGMRSRNRMRLTPAGHKAFLPRIPGTLNEALSALSRTHHQGPLDDAILKLRAEHGLNDDPEDFRARLSWGRAARDYLTYLGRYSLTRPESAEDGTYRRIRRLVRELDDLLVLEGLEDIRADAAAGRTVLLCLSHSGATPLVKRLIRKVGLPEARIGANGDTDLSGKGDLRLGTKGDFQTDFLKMLKIVKKTPHLIRLFPDGGQGAELLWFDFMGRRVPLGPGGATLAWHSRAAVWFMDSAWRGDKLHYRLVRGPEPDRDAGREAFDAAFHAFYLDRCREIVLGPPEDIGAGGGFWPYLGGKGG